METRYRKQVMITQTIIVKVVYADVLICHGRNLAWSLSSVGPTSRTSARHWTDFMPMSHAERVVITMMSVTITEVINARAAMGGGGGGAICNISHVVTLAAFVVCLYLSLFSPPTTIRRWANDWYDGQTFELICTVFAKYRLFTLGKF